MRAFLVSVAALFLLVNVYSPVSAAATSALAKKAIYGQALTLVEKAGWKRRRWRRRWYGPRVYGYSRWYGPRKYGFRRWYGPPVYGSYLPYRYRRWRLRRTPVSVGP
jgi:hypothetical protein